MTKETNAVDHYPAELRVCPGVRWVNRGGLILQQKHEVWAERLVGDGCDGGQTWMALRPIGKYKWIDVPLVSEDDQSVTEESIGIALGET